MVQRRSSQRRGKRQTTAGPRQGWNSIRWRSWYHSALSRSTHHCGSLILYLGHAQRSRKLRNTLYGGMVLVRSMPRISKKSSSPLCALWHLMVEPVWLWSHWQCLQWFQNWSIHLPLAMKCRRIWKHGHKLWLVPMMAKANHQSGNGHCPYGGQCWRQHKQCG